MKEKEQRELLLDLLNIKEKLLELESKKLLAYEERTIINRKVKELEVQIKNAPLPREELPEDKIDIKALVDDLEAKTNENQKAERIRTKIQYNEDLIREKEEQIKKLTDDVTELRKQNVNNYSEFQGLEQWDLEPLREKIKAAEQVNNEIRQREEYLELTNQLKDVVGRSEDKTAIIESVENEKLEILKNSKKPIDGLEVNDEYVSFKSIPYVQLSSAEQLKVSLAIAMATNPDLKVIRITDGSLLDDGNMGYIDSQAKERGYQIFIERVSIDKFADIVMVDGEGAKVKAKLSA